MPCSANSRPILLVHLGFVGHQTGFAGDVGANDGVNVVGAELVERERTHGAGVAVDQRQNAELVSRASLGAATAFLGAEIGFIDLDSATARTERGSKIARAHGFADAVSRNQARLILDLKDAAKLVGADALLARRDQVDGLEHLVERHTGVFEHGADLDGELLAALATLFQAVTERAFGVLQARLGANARQVIDPTTDHTAMRADNAVSPNDAFQDTRKPWLRRGSRGKKEPTW